MKLKDFGTYKNKENEDFYKSFINKFNQDFILGYDSKDEVIKVDLKNLFEENYLKDLDIKGFYLNDATESYNMPINENGLQYKNFIFYDIISKQKLLKNNRYKEIPLNTEEVMMIKQVKEVLKENSKVELNDNLALETILSLGRYSEDMIVSVKYDELEAKKLTENEIKKIINNLLKEVSVRELKESEENFNLLLEDDDIILEIDPIIFKANKKINQLKEIIKIKNDNRLLGEKEKDKKKIIDINQKNEDLVRYIDSRYSKNNYFEKSKVANKIKNIFKSKNTKILDSYDQKNKINEIRKELVDELTFSNSYLNKVLLYTKDNNILVCDKLSIFKSVINNTDFIKDNNVQGVIELCNLSNIEKYQFINFFADLHIKSNEKFAELNNKNPENKISNYEEIKVIRGLLITTAMNTMSSFLDKAKIKIEKFTPEVAVSLNSFSDIQFLSDFGFDASSEIQQIIKNERYKTHFNMKLTYDDKIKKQINYLNYMLYLNECNENKTSEYLYKIKKVDDPTFIIELPKNLQEFMIKEQNAIKDDMDKRKKEYEEEVKLFKETGIIKRNGVAVQTKHTEIVENITKIRERGSSSQQNKNLDSPKI